MPAAIHWQMVTLVGTHVSANRLPPTKSGTFRYTKANGGLRGARGGRRSGYAPKAHGKGAPALDTGATIGGVKVKKERKKEHHQPRPTPREASHVGWDEGNAPVGCCKVRQTGRLTCGVRPQWLFVNHMVLLPPCLSPLRPSPEPLFLPYDSRF